MSTPEPKLPWYQFSLRSLLLLTAIVAAICSIGACTHWGVSVVAAVTLIGGMAGKSVARTWRGFSRRDLRKARIVGFSIVAAVAYGVLHDQITARICVEYFTVAHPPLFGTTSPTLLGICWGITATLGVGLVLGVGLALVSQSEGLPPIPIRHLFKSILALLAVAAVSALLARTVGFEFSQRSLVCLPAGLIDVIPANRQGRFMAVWFAHGASYLVGLTGGTFIILRIWWSRGRPRVLQVFPRTKSAILRALVLAAIVVVIVWYRLRWS